VTVDGLTQPTWHVGCVCLATVHASLPPQVKSQEAHFHCGLSRLNWSKKTSSCLEEVVFDELNRKVSQRCSAGSLP